MDAKANLVPLLLPASCVRAADDITPEMRKFPHHKYVLMALFDTLYNLLGSFPTPHIG